MSTRCDHCQKDTDDCTKCSLCRKTQYCSELCRQKAWTFHEQDCNVYNLPKGTCVARPYMFEDLATEDELKDSPKELHEKMKEQTLVRTVNPNGTISHVITAPGIAKGKVESGKVGAMGVGDEPRVIDLGDTYRITIQQNQWLVPSGNWATGPRDDFVVEGQIPHDFIYKNNKLNELANNLAKSRILKGKQAGKLLFWPGALKNYYELDGKGGHLTITVETFIGVDPTTIITKSYMEVNYGDLQFEGLGGGLKRLRKITGLFSRQLKLKGLDPGTHAAIHAKDAESMEVRLIFETTGKTDKRLKDIELMVPKKLLDKSRVSSPITATTNESDSVNFTINAKDIEAVTALQMAWDQHIVNVKNQVGNEKLANMYKTLDAIKAHQSALETFINEGNDPENFQYDPHINAVIHSAKEELWKEIGLRWKAAYDKNYYKMHKDDPPEVLRDEVDTLKIPEPGPGFKEKFKSWALGKRGKYKGRMRAIAQIIKERINKIRDVIPDAAQREANADYRLLVELSSRIRQAINA